MKRILILIFLSLSLILSGCATLHKDVVAIDTKKTVQIDPRLLQECPDLAQLVEPTEDALMAASKDWLEKYKDCRTWKHQLNETTKKAFNIP